MIDADFGQLHRRKYNWHQIARTREGPHHGPHDTERMCVRASAECVRVRVFVFSVHYVLLRGGCVSPVSHGTRGARRRLRQPSPVAAAAHRYASVSFGRVYSRLMVYRH